LTPVEFLYIYTSAGSVLQALFAAAVHGAGQLQHRFGPRSPLSSTGMVATLVWIGLCFCFRPCSPLSSIERMQWQHRYGPVLRGTQRKWLQHWCGYILVVGSTPRPQPQAPPISPPPSPPQASQSQALVSLDMQVIVAKLPWMCEWRRRMQTDVHSRCGTDVHSHCGVRTHGTAWQLDIRIHFTVYPGPSID